MICSYTENMNVAEFVPWRRIIERLRTVLLYEVYRNNFGQSGLLTSNVNAGLRVVEESKAL